MSGSTQTQQFPPLQGSFIGCVSLRKLSLHLVFAAQVGKAEDTSQCDSRRPTTPTQSIAHSVLMTLGTNILQKVALQDKASSAYRAVQGELTMNATKVGS